MESGRCHDCRWWKSNPPPFDATYGFCNLISDPSLHPAPLAMAVGHGGGAYVVTQQDFGCIQFQPRGGGAGDDE